MSPKTYSLQIASVETALKRARDANDLAAMLAALTTKLRLIRLHYAMRTATLAS